MNIIILSVIALCVSLVLGKTVLPAIKRTRLKGDFPEITKVGFVAALDYVRKFALYLSVTYAVLWGVNIVYGWYLRNSVQGDDHDFELWRSISKVAVEIKGISGWQWLWTLIVLLIVFLVSMYMHGRRQALVAYESLKKQRADGPLPELPPDVQMDNIREWMNDVAAERRRLFDIPDQSLTTEDIQRKFAAIKRLDGLLELGQAHWKEYDLRRRIEPEMERKGLEQRAPRFAGVLTALGSQGMLNLLRSTSSFLSKAGLVMLSLSFVMADSGRLGSTVGNHAKDVADLIAQRNHEPLEENWAEAMKARDQEGIAAKWTDEDESALDKFAQGFEQALAALQDYSGTDADDPAVTFHLRASTVRSGILKSFGPEGGTPRAGNYTVTDPGGFKPSDGSAADDAAKQFALKQSELASTDKPSTSQGRTFRHQQRAKAKANPSWWTAQKAKLKAVPGSFRTIAQPKDVFNMLVNDMVGKATGQALDPIFDGLEPTMQREVGKKMADKFTRAYMERYVKLKGDAFMDEVLRAPTYSEAFRSFSRSKTASDRVLFSAISETDLPTLRSIREGLRDFPATIDHLAQSPEQRQNTIRALGRLATATSTEGRAVADATLSYRYLFPGQPGMQATEPAARLAGEVVEASVNTFNGVANHARSSSYQAATRARSYAKLRGFRRIGGVLIGQEATNTGKSGADFRDITWAPTEGGIELFLHDAKGVKRSAGTYSNDIVNQALAYAADGRPVTITMVTAKPMPVLKVLAHPVLADTRLGCQAIELDRFVDKYASQRADVRPLLERYIFQEQLYKYACLKRFGQAKSIVFTTALGLRVAWDDIYRALDGGAVLKDPSRSHIAANTRLYADVVRTNLISALENCKGDFDLFDQALSSNEFHGRPESLLKVTTDLWSGVRERPYTVDASLSFLRPNEGLASDPLYFVEQVAYVPTDDALPDEWTENPWEFGELTKDDRISKLVLTGMNNSSNDRHVLQRLRAFALAQRLFRCALNGDLGYRFPVEKLQELQRQTRSAVEEVETPTWSRPLDSLEVEAIKSEMNAEGRVAFDDLIEASGVHEPRNTRPCR